MRDHAIEQVFPLFTSPDRAVAIAGDLAEESAQRGKFWFVTNPQMSGRIRE